MNYQDFESAWYLGLVITAFVAVMLIGVYEIFRYARELSRQEGAAMGAMALTVATFTFLFIIGICLALLIGIVALAGG